MLKEKWKEKKRVLKEKRKENKKVLKEKKRVLKKKIHLMQLALRMMVGVFHHVLVLDVSIKVLQMHYQGGQGRHEPQGVYEESETKK